MNYGRFLNYLDGPNARSQPPKSPNSLDKGTPPDKGAGGLGDFLPCLSPLIRGVQGDFGNFAGMRHEM